MRDSVHTTRAIRPLRLLRTRRSHAVLLPLVLLVATATGASAQRSSDERRSYGRLTEEQGYDRKGNDYSSFRARGLRDCTDACGKDSRCLAYTYDTRNDACYLKDRINSATRSPGKVTGYKSGRY